MGKTLSPDRTRIPTIVSGFLISITVHAAMLAMVAFALSRSGHAFSTPSVIQFARGEPMQVRLRTTEALLETAPVDFEWKPPAPRAATVVPHLEEAPVSTTVLEFESTIATTPVALPSNTRAMRQAVDVIRVITVTPPLSATEAHADNAQAMPAVRAGVHNGVSILDLAAPEYPPRAIRLGQEGTAMVEVEVFPNGAVGRTRLHSTSGFTLLDDAAMSAARAGRYQARDTTRAASTIIIPFRFSLHETR